MLKDIKIGEFRVIATPVEVGMLVRDGHEVYVSAGAGSKAGFDDAEYEAAGAVIAPDNETVWATCDFVAKVKEIEPSEYEVGAGSIKISGNEQEHLYLDARSRSPLLRSCGFH